MQLVNANATATYGMHSIASKNMPNAKDTLFMWLSKGKIPFLPLSNRMIDAIHKIKQRKSRTLKDMGEIIKSTSEKAHARTICL